MKASIEKQLVQWKEELNIQKQKKAQAEQALSEITRTILMIEGGIQAKEMLLKKIEQESQSSDTKASKQPEETGSSKLKA